MAIDFSKPRFPWFIRNIAGMWDAEPGGRWSTGATIAISFIDLLPKRFQLVIEGGAYGPNVGASVKVSAGKAKRLFTFLGSPGLGEKIVLEFSTRKPTTKIEITVPKPVGPPNDNRQIGLCLRWMRIEAIEEFGGATSRLKASS